MNEGNYFFSWEAVSATGICEGKYDQVIFGSSLSDAISTFTAQHGELIPNEDGVCLIITTISWGP